MTEAKVSAIVEHGGSRNTERRNRDATVIAAAITVMSRRGYAGSSIQQVADVVGVLKGSLYHYFTSKEELLYRILEESHQQTVDISVRVGLLELDPHEELLEYVRQLSLWYLDNVDRANIFFTEMKNLTGERLTDARGWGKHYESRIQQLVIASQNDGHIRVDLDARILTRFILGALNNVRHWPSRSGKKFTNEELSAAIVDLALSALAR